MYALENNIHRLADDHANAIAVANALAQKEWLLNILPVETNILIFSVQGNYTATSLVTKLAEKGIRCIAISPEHVRMVFHLDVTTRMVDKLITTIEELD